VGRTPSKFHVDTYSEYKSDRYLQEFDSWESALDEAGIEPDKKITDDELLDELRDFEGGEITLQKIKQDCKYGARAYRNRFDSIEKAVQKIKEDEGSQTGDLSSGTSIRSEDVPGNIHGIDREILSLKMANPGRSNEDIAEEVDRSTVLVKIVLEEHEDLIS
jgi:hypothetical protein